MAVELSTSTCSNAARASRRGVSMCTVQYFGRSAAERSATTANSRTRLSGQPSYRIMHLLLAVLSHHASCVCGGEKRDDGKQQMHDAIGRLTAEPGSATLRQEAANAPSPCQLPRRARQRRRHLLPGRSLVLEGALRQAVDRADGNQRGTDEGQTVGADAGAARAGVRLRP